jgi:hypothetical protein
MERNVVLVLLVRFLSGLSSGIWASSVLTLISILEPGAPEQVGGRAISPSRALRRLLHHLAESVQLLQSAGAAEALQGTCLALSAVLGELRSAGRGGGLPPPAPDADCCTPAHTPQ